MKRKPAAFEYVNRRGVRYLLCETRTKTGKPRYVFSREPVGSPVAAVPAGHEVAENVNGGVSLRKAGTLAIREDEIAAVKAALAKHPHLKRCRVEARKRELVVYESQTGDLEAFAQLFGSRAPQDLLDRALLSPVLRFVLDDDERRMFVVERMVCRGSFNGWHALGGGPLDELAERYVKHIGKESFYELM